MKKIVIAIMFIITSVFYFQGSEKQKVVFLDFKSANINTEITSGVMENLLTSIIENNVFTVIERSQLKKIFEELKLTSSDDFTDETALEIGKLAKAKIVFLGSVTKLGSRITINMRGIEVETGTALFAKKITVNSEDELPEAIDELADGISRVAASQNGQEFAEETEESSTNERPDRERDPDDPGDDRRERGDRQNRGQRGPVSAEYIKPIDDVKLSSRYSAEILKQVPIDLKGKVKAEFFIENKQKLLKVSSKTGRGPGVRWDYSFKILKDIDLSEIERGPAVAKVVVQDIKLPKKIQKESGLYLVCTSQTPGNYTVMISSGTFEAARNLYISHPMNVYFLPLSTFKVVTKNRRPVKEYQSLTAKMMAGTVSIHIEKNIFQILNNEVIKGANYKNRLEVEEMGFFTYKLKSEKGYVADFDNPLDRSNIDEVMAFAHREPSMRIFEALNMKMVEEINSGIDGHDGIAGDYLFFQLQIRPEQVDHEWGFNFSMPVYFDVSRFKAVTFLVRTRGAGAFTLVFKGKGSGIKFKPLFVPLDEWVRVTVPLSDFESERRRGGPGQNDLNYLVFVLNNFQLTRSGGGEVPERIRLEVDEIRFLP